MNAGQRRGRGERERVGMGGRRGGVFKQEIRMRERESARAGGREDDATHSQSDDRPLTH